MSDQEISAAERAAERHKLSRSEFARRAIKAAAEPPEKKGTAFPLGAWKGRTTYRQAMKLLRD